MIVYYIISVEGRLVKNQFIDGRFFNDWVTYLSGFVIKIIGFIGRQWMVKKYLVEKYHYYNIFKLMNIS